MSLSQAIRRRTSGHGGTRRNACCLHHLSDHVLLHAVRPRHWRCQIRGCPGGGPWEAEWGYEQLEGTDAPEAA